MSGKEAEPGCRIRHCAVFLYQNDAMGARIYRIAVVCVRTCLILKDFWSGDVIGIRFFRLDGARSGAKSACPSGKSPEFRRQKAYVGGIALAVMLNAIACLF